MKKVWKEVLLPNVRHCDRYGRWLEFSDTDIQTAHDNLKLMFERGVPVPLVYEHVDLEAGDDDAWRAAQAKYCFGHAGDCRISQTGALEVRHDLPNHEDVKRLKACKYVSPKIRPSWSDSRGGKYGGGTVVTHVALTSSPVQFTQKPFELSDTDTFFLAYSDTESPPEAVAVLEPALESCPDSKWSLDAWLDALEPVELSTTETPEESPVADENDTDEKPKGGEKKGGEGGEGKNADLKMVIDAIKTAFPSAKISDKVTNWSELAIALESQSGADAEPDAEPEPEADAGGGGDTTAAPGGPPMLMSTLDRDTGKRKKADAYAKPEREEAATRIKACFAAGKIDGATQRKLLRQADGFEMSFTDGEQTGKKWNTLLASVAEAEKQPAGKFAVAGKGGSVDLSTTTTAVDRPNLGNTPSEARTQAAVDFIVKGVRPAK